MSAPWANAWRGETHRIPAADGTDLAVGWMPSAKPRATLLLLHGISNHMGWYGLLAEALCAQGIAVAVPDRRGAGASAGRRGDLASWRQAVADVSLVARWAHERGGREPLHLMGVSLGGMFAIDAALAAGGPYRSLMLTTPALAQTLQLGWQRRARILTGALFAPGRRQALGLAAPDRHLDPVLIAEQGRDPLRTTAITPRFAIRIFRAGRRLRRQLSELDLPTLLTLAGDDHLVDNRRLRRLFADAKLPRLWTETLEGAPHVLHGAVDPELLAKRFITWIEAHGGERRRPKRRASRRITLSR